MTAVLIAVVMASVAGIVLWIRHTGMTDQQLAQNQAALDAEVKRRAEQEKEDAAAREKRTKEFDDKATKVANANDAAGALDLLRDATGRINSR
jgi:hypothetical protein